MRLPIVARRSPPMMIPPSNAAVTIVVACGVSGTSPAGSCRRPGSRCWAWTARKSGNDDEPGGRKAAGSPPPGAGSNAGSVTDTTLSSRSHGPDGRGRDGSSLPTLLHEALHELLGVALEDLVDLVEDPVEALFPGLGLGRGGHLGGVVRLSVATGRALLFLAGHVVP